MARAVGLLLLVACGDPDVQTAIVSPVRQPCVDIQGIGVVPLMCVSMLVDGSPEVADRIDGFVHRWGTESELQVRFTEVMTVDSRGYWTLVGIVDEQPTTIKQFEIEFAGRGDFWFDDVRSLFGTAVQIDTQELLDEMLAAGGPDESFTLSMEFLDNGVLHVISVQ